MEQTLKALIITFLVLFAAGFLVFAGFFITHKVFFNKQWKLMDKYNNIRAKMYGINFFRIDVLHNNSLIPQDKYDKIKTQYETINKNLSIIYENIVVLTGEINSMNLKPANNHLAYISKQLSKTAENMKVFEVEYNKYTAYPDEISNVFQTYLDIFESLDDFYNHKIIYHKDFKMVNALFKNIARTIKAIPEFGKKFNYTKTINVLVDLHNKIESLIKILFVILRFQVVQIYLKTSMDKNNKIILANYKSIAHTDLPTLQKSINIYRTSYMGFVKSFKALDLKNAHRQIIMATKALTNINQFCFIHSQTKDLINVSLQEIKEQTNQIIANKEHILASIEAISSYFVRDNRISKWFKTITKDLNKIEKLVDESDSIDYQTHSQKIKALESLANISTEIVAKKDEINQNIANVNKELNQVISAVNDLNDLYIYFCQLLSVANKTLADNQEAKLLKSAINDNLNTISLLTNEIITNEKPDFNHITSSIVNIINQVNQIYNKVNNELVLKSYASKLIVYANRYRTIKENNDQFKLVDKSFKDKQYAKCIDQLISLINENK